MKSCNEVNWRPEWDFKEILLRGTNKINRQELLNTKLNSARAQKQGTADLPNRTGIRRSSNAEVRPNLQTFMQRNQCTSWVLPPQQLVQPGVKLLSLPNCREWPQNLLHKWKIERKTLSLYKSNFKVYTCSFKHEVKTHQPCYSFSSLSLSLSPGWWHK